VRAFFDSNVIVYAHDPRAGVKQQRAAALLDAHAVAGTLVVGTQVLIESYNVLLRRELLSRAEAIQMVETLARVTVVPADAASVLRGLRLAGRHQLSHRDGLIVQAALDAGCATLFTEDMQAGQRFGELEVVNPFADAAHEARPAYAAKTARKSGAAKRKPAAARKR
jgi:predicted nucleic acid-binding protein